MTTLTDHSHPPDPETGPDSAPDPARKNTLQVLLRLYPFARPALPRLALGMLAAGTVLMSSAAPRSAALLEGLGYRVVTVGISEFEKLEGCVTCLSVRVR